MPQAEPAHANIDDVHSVSRKGKAMSVMARAAAMDASQGEAAEAREELTRLQERVRHCDENVNAARKALVEEGRVWKNGCVSWKRRWNWRGIGAWRRGGCGRSEWGGWRRSSRRVRRYSVYLLY